MTEVNCDICILGGGITGLTIAYKLVSNGVNDFILLEKEGRVGGLLNYHEFNGIKVDYGPHRLYIKNKEIEEYIMSLLDSEYIVSTKKSRIFFSKDFQIRYPPTLSVAVKLAIRNPIRSLLSIIHVISSRREESNLEEWLIKRFGKFYYDVIFRDYNIKMWGEPPDKLSPRLGGKRIENISIINLLMRVFKSNDRHKALISSFFYPSTSIYQLCSSLEDRYLSDYVHKNEEVVKIERLEPGVLEVTTEKRGGESKKIICNKVVTTIPINSIKMPAVQCESLSNISRNLRYRSLIIVYLYVDKENVIGDHWVYFPGKQIFHRVFEQKNFNSKGFGNKTIIGAEIVCDYGDKTWRTQDQELIRRVSIELKGSDLLDENDIINSSVLKLKDSYPIYINGFEESRNSVLSALRNVGVYSCGRQGGFEYNSIEDSIASAFKIANNLIMGR
jgi:protoporphyrinogen oxidase